MEPKVPENLLPKRKLKKPVSVNSPPKMAALTSTAKTLVRRELKTMKLIVQRQGNLGIFLERREAVRPFYIISRMDPRGDAAKSNQFRVGDEIVSVCGQKIRRMSEVEAGNALRSCFGAVELQIAREPTFAFGGEFEDTLGENLITKVQNDLEIWSRKSFREGKKQELRNVSKTLEDNIICNTTDIGSLEEGSFPKEDGLPRKEKTSQVVDENKKTRSCEIIEAITKDGRSVTLAEMNGN